MPGELGKLEFRFAEFCASFRAVDGAASSDEGKPETILHGESALKVAGCASLRGGQAGIWDNLAH
jgi:hypothetical protein